MRSQRLRRVASLVDSGVNLICLAALNDDGAPSYDGRNAADLAHLGVPTFACTPELFPDLMAAALERKDIHAWAARHDVPIIRE